MLESLIAIVLLTNAQRITPVHLDQELTVRAAMRANELCEKQQWSHDGWIDSFKGIPYHYAGENLSRRFDSDDDAFKALMLSPGHRANITNEHYSKMGVWKACGITVYLFTG